jgi:DNA-binding response OmpR family regulator
MRLLVLDGSQVLHSLVRRLAPEGVAVERAPTFDRAIALLVGNPPDAVMVNIGPADLPWQRFQGFCQSHSPKIPVLFESCIYRDAAEAGLDALDPSAQFLAKPYSADLLKAQIERLIDCAAWCRTHPEAEAR